MQLLELTLPTVEENVALDEALLDAAEEEGGGEVLRLWEPAQLAVVIGRSSRAAEEVDLEACRRRGIRVVRRPSGGAAIVTGPGCLMYALVLSYRRRPHLRMIDEVHAFVLGRLADALAPLAPGARHCGTSDLAAAGRKFSGNSLRAKRDHCLYHGTLLVDFPLHEIGALLRMPPRQPEYRQGRAHGEFIANLELPLHAVRQAVIEAFQARDVLPQWPEARTRQLAQSRYRRDEWNLSR